MKSDTQFYNSSHVEETGVQIHFFPNDIFTSHKLIIMMIKCSVVSLLLPLASCLDSPGELLEIFVGEKRQHLTFSWKSFQIIKIERKKPQRIKPEIWNHWR